MSKLKVILLGDSAVGKSKLIERFLIKDYVPIQNSTFAVTIYPFKSEDGALDIQFWDTAGQERFNSMHASYYHGAHCCLLCFDLTRKQTYQNLKTWYSELRTYCPTIPVIVFANKIDADPNMAKRNYDFCTANGLDLYFVSASDGANVVAAFAEGIERAKKYKETNSEFMDQVLELLKD